MEDNHDQDNRDENNNEKDNNNQDNDNQSNNKQHDDNQGNYKEDYKDTEDNRYTEDYRRTEDYNNPDEEQDLEQERSFKIRKRIIQFIGVILVISMILSQYQGAIQNREIEVKPVKNGIQIQKRGVVEAPYTIKFASPKAMLSRDGSEAQPITTGTPIEKPGLYYLTLFNEKESITVETFVIEIGEEHQWKVETKEDLMEVFKYAMENVQEKITMVIKKDLLEETVIFEAVEAVRDLYPNTVVPQGYEISYSQSEDGTDYLADLFFDYGIKIASVKQGYKEKIDNRLQNILAQTIEADMTDLKKEYSILDYIVKTTSYSQERVGKEEDYPPLTHTIYGAVIDGIAVCDGYSKELNYLLNAVGVPSRMIVGTSREQGHQWNLVKIEGDYYHVDVTWADSGSAMEMRYINQNDKSMHFTHQWDVSQYPEATQTGSLLLPHFETKQNILEIKNLKKLFVLIPAGIIIAFVVYSLKRRKD